MPTIKKPIYLISVVFFLSGCSALIFETIWFRTASIVLGSSIWSAAAVLMAFMGGLGLGNALMALRGDRVTHPLRTYIAIELVIGISGVCAIYFLPTISPLVAEWLVPFTDHGSLLNFFRFCTAFVALLLPSIAMGMTIPLLQKFLYKYDHSFSKSLGILYGFNTLGAEQAVKNGWAGLVIYGCVRDVDALIALDLGVQALAAIPLKTEKRGIGDLNIPVSFAGVTFNPGEYLYADNNGVVVSAEALV